MTTRFQVSQVSLRRAGLLESDRTLVIRGRFQRNNSWDDKARMAFIDTILVFGSCAPIFIIIDEETDDEHVFDGAHRLETLLDFFDNKFPITKVNKSDILDWESSALAEHEGKYWKDLPKNLKAKIREFVFDVNVIPNHIAENPQNLATLWVRLNNSGKPLNEYEKYKPVYNLFYSFLDSKTGVWAKTILFKDDPAMSSENRPINRRGEINELVMEMLALSEPSLPTTFNSVKDLVYNRWLREIFGTTFEVEKNLLANKPALEIRVKHLWTVFDFLTKKGALPELKPKKSGESSNTPNALVMQVLIARIAAQCPRYSDLTRNEEDLIEYVKHEVNTSHAEHMARHGANSVNRSYQKKLFEELNYHILSLVRGNREHRVFSPVAQRAKLEEQSGLCWHCSKTIAETEVHEGHHIRPYAKGGGTTPANLAVVHDFCHKAIHAK